MRAVKEYFGDEKVVVGGGVQAEELVPRPVVSTAHAILDRFLGHAMVNGTLPTTIFAMIGMYDPKALEAIVDFFKNKILGKHALALFPLVNFVIAGIVTGIEFGVRNKRGTLAKEDKLIHTPFPQINAFDRKKAVLFFLVAYGLQTLNGVLAEHPDLEAAKIMRKLYENPLFTFYGQMVATLLADKLLFMVVPVIATKTYEAGVFAVSKVSACVDAARAKFNALCEEEKPAADASGAYKSPDFCQL